MTTTSDIDVSDREPLGVPFEKVANIGFAILDAAAETFDTDGNSKPLTIPPMGDRRLDDLAIAIVIGMKALQDISGHSIGIMHFHDEDGIR